jgi:hypothetical protein
MPTAPYIDSDAAIVWKDEEIKKVKADASKKSVKYMIFGGVFVEAGKLFLTDRF